jgi:O-methyltransferase
MNNPLSRWRLSPGQSLDEMPAPLRPLTKPIRNFMVGRVFNFWSDGLATVHYCPFMDDPHFEASYREMSEGWLPNDVRWRMWFLISLARECRDLPGNFAEFGTWRGGCAYMILDNVGVAPERRFFLFDTFSGVPADRLTPHERDLGFAGSLADTSVKRVDELLSRWRPAYQLCPGDVFDTLDSAEVGALSFAHIDLNATAPTRHALEFTYEHMLPGGIIAFDDYGWIECKDQRHMIDEFFADLPETPLALPTGQACVIRR